MQLCEAWSAPSNARVLYALAVTLLLGLVATPPAVADDVTVDDLEDVTAEIAPILVTTPIGLLPEADDNYSDPEILDGAPRVFRLAYIIPVGETLKGRFGLEVEADTASWIVRSEPEASTPSLPDAVVVSSTPDASIRSAPERAVASIEGMNEPGPPKDKSADLSGSETKSPASNADRTLIDINTASVSTLNDLPEAGRVGGTIVRHRPYRSVSELVTRKILRSDVYQKIKTKLTVN